MFVFKLFEGAEETHPIDARFLTDGILRIGRDPAADWVLSDPSLEISRWHCELQSQNDVLHLKALGANGVFSADGVRFAQDEEIALAVPSIIRFGVYRLSADYAPQGNVSSQGVGNTLILSPPMGSSIAVPTDWSDNLAPGDNSGESLLNAFCEGAGLHASAFAADDPADVMRQAGAVYRQMLLGVADLMTEREQTRQRYALALTTVSGSNNNPFKWAPSHRLAVDLLRPPRAGFMPGQDALAASFRDIKKLSIGVQSGPPIGAQKGPR